MFRIDELIEKLNLRRPDGTRLDASESVALQRQLLISRNRLYEVKFPELDALTWVPPESTPLDPGANHFTYSYVEHYGDVALQTGMARRGPLAEVKKTEATPIPFVSKTNAYAWTLQDMRSAAMANFALPSEKATAARRVMAFWHDDAILIGDGTATWDGLTGLFKLSGTHTYTVPNGALGSPTWELKTPDEILADMHGIVNGVISNSKNVESPDTLGIPLTSWLHINSRRMTESDSKTVLTAFLEQRQKLRPGFQVRPHNKLETAGASSVKRMIAYEANPEKVARLDSVPFEQNSPQVEGWTTVTDCHQRTAGVYTAYPKSISYGDGI